MKNYFKTSIFITTIITSIACGYNFDNLNTVQASEVKIATDKVSSQSSLSTNTNNNDKCIHLKLPIMIIIQIHK